MNSIVKIKFSISDTLANKVFNEAYDLIETAFLLDPKWNNGTGYFDNAVYAVKLDPGAFATAVCMETNRRLIFIGTGFGTLVVFERFANGENGVFVHNGPARLDNLKLTCLPNGRLGYDQLCDILGMWFTGEGGKQYRGEGNIHSHLEAMAASFKDYRPKVKQAA